jgi:hypothetical protein
MAGGGPPPRGMKGTQTPPVGPGPPGRLSCFPGRPDVALREGAGGEPGFPRLLSGAARRPGSAGSGELEPTEATPLRRGRHPTTVKSQAVGCDWAGSDPRPADVMAARCREPASPRDEEGDSAGAYQTRVGVGNASVSDFFLVRRACGQCGRAAGPSKWLWAGRLRVVQGGGEREGWPGCPQPRHCPQACGGVRRSGATRPGGSAQVVPLSGVGGNVREDGQATAMIRATAGQLTPEPSRWRCRAQDHVRQPPPPTSSARALPAAGGRWRGGADAGSTSPPNSAGARSIRLWSGQGSRRIPHTVRCCRPEVPVNQIGVQGTHQAAARAGQATSSR